MIKVNNYAIRIILLLSASLPVSQAALANGFIESSAREKSGGVVLDNQDGLQLNSEKLDITMQPDGYQVKVRYEISSKSPYQGTLYFPMICYELVEKCILTVDVKVDGNPVSVSYEQQDGVIEMFGDSYKAVAWDKLQEYGYFSELLAYDEPTDEQIKQALKVRVVTAPVITSSTNFTLDVTYKVSYIFSSEGTSKSAIYEYSDDIVYYDFSPAGLWAKNRVASLEVSVDTGVLSDALTNHGGWMMQKSGSRYTATLHQVAMSKLEPLIIGMNRSNYHQYKDFQRALAYSSGTSRNVYSGFSLFSTDELSSKDGRYAASKAADGDFSTAWCSNSKELMIKVVVPPSKVGYCNLNGVALFNGYTKSRKIWNANNRVKALSVAVKGISTSGEGLSYTKSIELPRTQLLSESNPYSVMHFIPLSTSNLPRVGRGGYQHMDDNHEVSIELRVIDVYQGDTYHDTCVSEVLPVYNCG